MRTIDVETLPSHPKLPDEVVTRAILFAASSATHRLPSEPTAIPRGAAHVVAVAVQGPAASGYSYRLPVVTFIFAT